jgi:hypothetical protein
VRLSDGIVRPYFNDKAENNLMNFPYWQICRKLAIVSISYRHTQRAAVLITTIALPQGCNLSVLLAIY